MNRLPLAAVRVIELDAGPAGAQCARLLGDMGAEVIKIEPPAPPQFAADPLRFDLDRNKLGCAMETTNDAGLTLLQRLAQISRFVIAPHQAGRLPAKELREANRGLIIVSLPSTDNPLATPIEDVTLGTAAAAAALVALLKHRRTGEGSLVELSRSDLPASFQGELTLRDRPPGQTRSDAPCGCFPCRRGRAVAIAVHSDDEFAALCDVTGRSGLRADHRFSDAASRLENEEELNLYVSQWTRARSAEKAAQALQEAGVTAAPVLSPADLPQDAHLRHRRFFELVSHPAEGERETAGILWRFSRTPAHTRLPAPLPGQHNAYVFGGLLGLSKEEMADLSGRGVIGRV